MKHREQVPAILAVIRHDDKFLLLKRHPKSRFEPDKWGFIGEAIEYGESPVGCLKRGVKDETNLELRSWKLFDVYSFCFESPEKDRHAVLTVYICEPVDTEVKINEESADFGWFTLEEIKRLDLIRGNEKIVGDLKVFFSRDEIGAWK